MTIERPPSNETILFVTKLNPHCGQLDRDIALKRHPR
jgi:hypothetical protein